MDNRKKLLMDQVEFNNLPTGFWSSRFSTYQSEMIYVAFHTWMIEILQSTRFLKANYYFEVHYRHFKMCHASLELFVLNLILANLPIFCQKKNRTWMLRLKLIF